VVILERIDGKMITTGLEKEVCDWFTKVGFWVISVNQGKVKSTMCDIIAIKDNECYFFNCKILKSTNGIFDMKRNSKEEIAKYREFNACGNTNMWLCLLWKGDYYVVNFNVLDQVPKRFRLNEDHNMSRRLTPNRFRI
jgi:Holliday junction resolvase